MATTREVLSSPLGGTDWVPIIRNRVELSGSSSIFSANTFRPYSSAAILPAMAAAFHSPFKRRAASALLFTATRSALRSEEHTSELQSRGHLVCSLLPEQKTNRAIHRTEKTPTISTAPDNC